MKYFAILRDSFREAIDSKVIYVLVALSLLVTLFMLSTSFAPLSAEEGFRTLFDRGGLPLNKGQGRANRPINKEEQAKIQERKDGQAGEIRRQVFDPRPRYQGVELVKGAPDSPDSEYRITFYVDLGDKQTAAVARKAFAEKLKELSREFAKAEEAGLFKVSEMRVADNATNKFAKEADQRKLDEGIYLEMETAPTAATRRVWPVEVSLFFGAVPLPFTKGAPLGIFLYGVTALYLWMGSLVTLLISIIITAFFIPNMLRKGTVDLLVVKPIHRWVLLTYKYIGGLTFVFLNTAVALVGIWLALGLRSGIWANSFLLMIFVFTFFFAILYAVSTLAAVLTRSAIVAILLTCAAWFIFSVIGLTHAFFDTMRQEEAKNRPYETGWRDNTFGQVVRAIHFVSPRTAEIDALGSKLLLADFLTEKTAQEMTMRDINWGESLAVSLGYIVLFLGISCWWFSTKDY